MAKSENTKPFQKIEIPNDWHLKKLGDIFNFKNGINAAKESYGNGVKFINVMEIIYNEFIISEIIPGSVQISDIQKELYKVNHGDVLFNRTSETTDEIGLSAVYYGNDDVVFGGFVIRGRPIDASIDDIFKRYCFHSKIVRDQIIKSGQGAVRTNIGQSELEKVVVPLPPIPEQKAIAQILSLMDSAINKNNLLMARKELQKKWLMQNLLTGNKRLMGFVGKWKECHLGELFSERTETKYFDLPLLSVGAGGIYPQTDSIKKDTSNNDKSKYKRICPGDIGYNTMRMWQGRSALSQLEGIVSPAYTIVTPKKNADPLYFSYLFKTPKLMNLFWRNSQGLVDDTLNCKFKDFKIVKVNIPKAKEEQTAIAKVLQAADKEVLLLNTKIEKLREKKKGLMQQLLTGKVRLKLKNDIK